MSENLAELFKSPAELFNSLRASTAALLGYDADHLTAAQQIRVDRAVMLRLLIDDMTTKQMRGEAIDVRAFVAASEDLERMVGGDPTTSSTAHDFSGAHEELSRLLDLRATAIERRDEKLRDQIARLTEENAKLQAKLKAVEPQPGAAAEQTPEPSSNIAYLPSRTADGQPPRHYLRESQPREAWRDFYDGRATGPHPWPLP